MVCVSLQDDRLKIDVPFGSMMREIAFKSGASMEFGCRVGDCATCMVQVLSGEELLSKQSDKERHLLELLDLHDRGLRLMCQCSVQANEGEIVISYARGC